MDPNDGDWLRREGSGFGLLDFPAIIDNQDVYLCWKLGEDRIRFYHRQDEGFAGRKPLDPRDLDSSDTVQ